MAKYHTLDLGPVTDFSVDRSDIKRKRIDGDRSVHTAADIVHAYVRKANRTTQPLPSTFKWMAVLPRHVRPFNLLRQFPRVANALAASWPQRETFRSVLYDLLVDKRQNRKGFPDDVRCELLALRSHFEESR